MAPVFVAHGEFGFSDMATVLFEGREDRYGAKMSGVETVSRPLIVIVDRQRETLQ